MHISFCDLSFDIQTGSKPKDKVQKILQQFISVLNGIDDSAFVVQYNQTLIFKDRFFTVLLNLIIQDASSLSRFSLKLAQYFPQCKLKYNKTYTKVQSIYNYSLENIISNIEDKLSNYCLAIQKKTLQHQNTSSSGWLVYFDPRCNPKHLTQFLKDPLKRFTKDEPIIAFRSIKVFNSNKKTTTGLKHLILKKKKEKEDFLKAFYIELLNEQKAILISAFKKISVSDIQLIRYDIKCKLIYYLDYFYDNDKLTRNNNFLLKHSQVLANIRYVEAPGIVFVYC